MAGHKGLVGSALKRCKPNYVDIVEVEKNILDLRNKEQTSVFLKNANVDVVVVAAARVGGILANASHQRKFLTENLEIQDSIINGAADAGIKNLVFLGSSCIYPKLAPQPISEESILTGRLEETNEGYALAKIAGIRLCKAISEELGFNYFSLMPTNMYGPNDNFDLVDSHVPAAFLRRFHEAKSNGIKEVEVWGSGKPLREFMHADDLASAIWYLLRDQQGGELINVGSGIELTIFDFAKLVAKVVGYEGEIVFERSKPDGTPRKLLDSSKINKLGWKASIGLEQGLADTYKWFVETLKKGEVRGIKA